MSPGMICNVRWQCALAVCAGVTRRTFESVMVITLTWRVVSMGSSPSSFGSQWSFSSTLLMAVFWCSPAMRRLMISAAGVRVWTRVQVQARVG